MDKKKLMDKLNEVIEAFEDYKQYLEDDSQFYECIAEMVKAISEL